MTFRYSFLANFIYWQANFPLSIIILTHAIIYASLISGKPIYIIWVVIDLAIIFFLNRRYFINYKLYPRKIELTETQIICYDYFLSSKKFSLRYTEIDDMRGGAIAGKQHKPILIYSDKNNITIAVRPHLINYNKFLTLILSKVNKEVYDEIIKRVEELGAILKNKRDKRRSKKKKQ